MAHSSAKRSWSRTTGLVYLFYFLTAVAGQGLEAKGLAKSGRAADFISILLYLALGLLFYRLLHPAGNLVSLLALLANLAGGAMNFAGFFRNGNAPVEPLWFFGMYCLLYGALIVRSTFLPRVLGIVNMIAGIGWLVFLAPLHVHLLTVSIEVFGFLAEASLMAWLLARGVNERKWLEQRASF